MGCRKNQASLTSDERKAFVNAVLKLKNEVPSQMGLTNRYDDYVQVHMNAMTASPGWAHQLPAFLPWHREFLRHFELDLQKIDPTVTIPYWDWTVDQNPALSTSPFTDVFMGGGGDPSQDDRVTTGLFAQVAGKWPLNITTGDPPPVVPSDPPRDNTTYLRREFGINVSNLPSPTQLGVALNKTLYDVSPWNRLSIDGFRNFVEGWRPTGGGPQNHNRVHVWVGGNMLPMTSPNDPVFWLNHCNIDRLWGLWMTQHPTADAYLPPSGTPGVPSGHGLNDTMIFFAGGPAPWPDSSTPAGVTDHHALGYWYDTDQPRVLLLTPSVSFAGIQQGIGGTGITTYRPIKFECESCGDVTLAITAGPTAGFGAPALAETVHPNHDPTSGLSPSQGALWISYTSTTPGSSITGSVTVQATDVSSGTVLGTWTVNLSADTVSRQASAIALVLDRSGSMATDAGNGHQRVELLRTAVSTFVDLMQQGDGLSIVRFDNLVDTLMPVTDVGAMPGGAGRTQAQDIVTTHDPAKTLDPRGSTSIGGGIVAGKAALDAVAGTYSRRAMVVLTDGLENTPPMISGVSTSLNDHTFAIGFGQAAAISTAALHAITKNHGGYLIVTGPITPEENFALTEYFLKIQAGVNNSTAVLDPRGELIFGVTHRIPFQLTRADFGIDVVLLSPAPYHVDFRLETPDGKIIDPGVAASEAAISFISTPRVSYYRASLPMLIGDPKGSHGGQWHVLLRLGDRAKDGDRQLISRLGRAALPYSLLVHAYSNLDFRPSLVQSNFEPGASVQLRVAIDQYNIPLDTPTTAWAEIQRPDGTSAMLMLTRTDVGRFSANFTASDVGVYTARVRAKGVTFEGQNFQREQRLTAVVFMGGNQTSQQPGDDRLCQLLQCLLSGQVIGPEFERELASHGFNVKGLVECMEKHCRELEGTFGNEKPYVPHAAFEASRFDVRAEVQSTLLAAEQQAATAPAHFAELVQGQPIPKPKMEPMIQNFGVDLTKTRKRPQAKPPEKDEGNHK
jgi:hypothetical protein